METGTIELLMESSKASLNAKTTGGISMEIFESIYVPAEYKISIASLDVDMWNSIANNVSDLKMSFRFGVSVSTGGVEWSEYRNIQLTKLTLVNAGSQIRAIIEASDMSFLLQQTPQRVFSEKTITEIVTQIAQENDLKTDISVSSNAKFSLVQAGMSEKEFLQDVLSPRARGRTLPILFYMLNGDTLVFKERKRSSPALNYSWQGDNKKVYALNQVKSVMTLTKSNFGTRGVTFDPLKRQIKPYAFTIDANDASELKESQYSPGAVTSFEGHVAVIDSLVIDNLDMDAEKVVKERVNWNPPLGMFRTALPSPLIPSAKIGTTVQVDTGTAKKKKMFDTGEYLMYAVMHRIANEGDVSTTTFLERRGAKQ